MAIIEKTPRVGKIIVDLTGPQGNAHFLIGYASQLSKQLEHSKEDREQIQSDMMSGDYENLLQVFDKAFGNYIDLVR